MRATMLALSALTDISLALSGCAAASAGTTTTVPPTTTTTHPALPACGPNYIGGLEPPPYCTPGA